MKTAAVILALALGMPVWTATAQDRGGPPPGGDRAPPPEGAAQGGPGMRGPRMVPPIIEALDLNKDGTIDTNEIAKAAASLKTLDKNGDGKLTDDEYRPPRPGGPGMPGQGGPDMQRQGEPRGQGMGGQGDRPGGDRRRGGPGGQGAPGGQGGSGGEGLPPRPPLEQ